MAKQVVFRTTKTNPAELPEGFILEEPNVPAKPTELPEDFVLDSQQEDDVLVRLPRKTVDFFRKYGMAEFGDPIEITGEESRAATRTLAQIGGGMAGGAVGATAGHPIVGAGLGGATAESLVQLGEHAFAPEAAPKTPWEAGKKIGWAGGREMLEEGIARAVIKVGAPFARKISPKTKEVINYLKRHKGRLTPAQATEDRTLDMLENIAESSLLGGGRMFEFKRGQEVLLDTIADDIASRLGTRATKEQAGEVVQAIIKNKTDAFRKVGAGLYKKADDALKGVMISTKSLKKEATRLLKQIKPTAKIAGKTKELMPSLANKNTIKMLRDFQNLPDAVQASFLNQWRGDLLQVGYAPSDIIPGKTAGMAKHLVGKIDNLFKQAEGGLTGEAAQALGAANSYWRLGKERFNSALIKRIAKKNPEYVLPAFIKRGNIADIQEVRKLIGPRAWEDVRGAYIQDLLFTQARDTSGILSGKKLQNILNKMTPETMIEIFGKASTKEIKLFADTAMAIQQKAAGGGGMLIQLTQAGAILSLPAFVAGGMKEVGAATTTTILLGPYAMGRLFTNPTGIKWLTEGLVTSAISKGAIRLTPRLIHLIGKEALAKDEVLRKERMAVKQRQQRPAFGHHF